MVKLAGPDFVAPVGLEPFAPESLEAGIDTALQPAVGARTRRISRPLEREAAEPIQEVESRLTRIAKAGLPWLGKLSVVLSLGLLTAFVSLGLRYGRILGPSLLETPPLSQTQLVVLLETKVDFLQLMLLLTGFSFISAIAGLLAALWNRHPGAGIGGMAFGVAAPFVGFCVFMVRGLIA
jgi:hypothetical protein